MLYGDLDLVSVDANVKLGTQSVGPSARGTKSVMSQFSHARNIRTLAGSLSVKLAANSLGGRFHLHFTVRGRGIASEFAQDLTGPPALPQFSRLCKTDIHINKTRCQSESPFCRSSLRARTDSAVGLTNFIAPQRARWHSVIGMKHGTHWVIVDTETDGLCAPIHIVELAAQRMQGWEPVGEPFRMFLNHNVPIPPEAFAVHGYSREFLRKNGNDPRAVHAAFREYADGCPVVAHNLSYDWNRCLRPEWARLGIPPIGSRGFCTLTLSRRLLPGIGGYRLDALKERFALITNRSHEALSDVFTVVELFRKIHRERLEQAGLVSFEAIATFAALTPIAKCRAILEGEPLRLKTKRG